MSSLRIFLRPGEKVFLNGAVLRADRKVSLEVLNDVTFLLESHVIQAHETTTPLKQLYFIIQAILIDPANAGGALRLYETTRTALLDTIVNPQIRDGLKAVDGVMQENRPFEALKMIRQLFPIEQDILNAAPAMQQMEREAV